MSNLRHLIRGISQLEVKPKNPDPDVSKYDKYIARLKAPISLAESISSANKLVLWISSYQLGNPSEPWLVTRRLVRHDMPANARLAGCELYIACVQSRPNLPSVVRLMFFNDIEYEFSKEDFDFQIKAFMALTKEGKDISGFDKSISLCLAKWIDRALMNLDSRKHLTRRGMTLSIEMRHQDLRILVVTITSILKSHFSILEEEHIKLLIDKIILTCKRTGDAHDIQEALSFFDVLIRYGYIPINNLNEVVNILCSIYHGLPNLSEPALTVVQNLLKSHMSHSTLKALRGIILGSSNVHDDVILGALDILTSRWTRDSGDQSSYTFTLEALFFSYREGLLAVQTRQDRNQAVLDASYLSSLYKILRIRTIAAAVLYDDWCILLDIMLLCARNLGGGRLKSDYEVLTPGPSEAFPIDDVFTRLLALIEEYFYDEDFSVPGYKLAGLWSSLSSIISERSAQSLLRYHTAELSCYPSNASWLKNIQTLGANLFLDCTQPQTVRVGFLKHLSGIVALTATTGQEESLHRLILELVRTTTTEPDTESSAQAALLIVEILDLASFPNCEIALEILKSLLLIHVHDDHNVEQVSDMWRRNSHTSLVSFMSGQNRPERVSGYYASTTAQNRDSTLLHNSNSNDHDLSRSAHIVITGLVTFFERRFKQSPHHITDRVFEFLLDILGNRAMYLDARLRVLALFSRMRADSDYNLYFDDETGTVDDISSDTDQDHADVHQYDGIRSRYICNRDDRAHHLPIEMYLQVTCNVIASDVDRQAGFHVAKAMVHQLGNRHMFVNCDLELKNLRTTLCDRLLNPSTQPTPDSRGENILVIYVELLSMLVGYHELYTKSQEDEVVAAIQSILSRNQKATPACIHALTICAYEMPLSTTKNLSSILVRLSQLVTSTNASVHILEFLSALAKIPSQYVNFREEDYRRVFGITLQHIQYASATVRDAAVHGGSNPLSNPVSAYMLTLAFDTLYAWFLAVKLTQRPRFLKWIVDGLISASPQSRSLDERGQVCYDFLARFCFSNSEIKSVSSVLKEFEADQSSTKSWLYGNSIMTMKTMNLSGLTEITIRRPSGSTSFLCKPNSDLEALSIISSSDARSIISHDALVGPTESKIRKVINGSEATAFTPSHMLLQMFVPPELFRNDKPMVLMEDDTTKRALSTLDRIPVVDFHKIGVIYVGRGQSEQREILANTYGSPEYVTFLEGLGDLVRLKANSAIYTGGLDTETDEDGEFAYAYKEKITQIIFHTCTLMPTRQDLDPSCTRKKSHIGNDFVNIIWNSSNRPYNPNTIPSEFNFINIVVSPDAYQTTRSLKDNSTHWKEPFYKVKVLAHTNLPEISPVQDWRLVSASKLSNFVRTVAIHCNIYAQIHHAHGSYTSMWRQRLDRIHTLRTRTQLRFADEVSTDDAKQHGYDFTLFC